MPRNGGWLTVQDQEEALENIETGWWHVCSHSLFSVLSSRIKLVKESELCPADGWAVVTADGEIHLNSMRLAESEEWAYVLAHCLLHLAFGHFQEEKHAHLREWNVACDCYIAKFLYELDLGTPPKALKTLLHDLRHSLSVTIQTEERLYKLFLLRGIPASLEVTGTAGKILDMHQPPFIAPKQKGQKSKKAEQTDWQASFARGLGNAVAEVVSLEDMPTRYRYGSSQSEQARNWFIGNFPLLGALAATFEIIEDKALCQSLDISVAAINMERKEIYINPQAQLNELEMRFVMAHEFLHAGLRHDVRASGRDPFLWNVACDYVVNGWLVEMGIGKMPDIGILYDPTLKNESSEAIYDRLIQERRRHPYRNTITLRGKNMGDMLDHPGWWKRGKGVELDEFYRSCLSQGLDLQEQLGRGYLSAGLIEEIRALGQPPISWDVELAQWFDMHFPPTEKVRTYARLSRRQSSTPDIPRPLWVKNRPQQDYERTFGVLLDTSGSMSKVMLAKALGAIASYSIARDVIAVRVVFCDAAAYDQGYMEPEEIAGRVKIHGRGGTILQPGIDLLDRAKDFPEQGPLLIITDGLCDVLHTRRSHAFLMPEKRELPFTPKGPVFQMK
jgi:predicted metal-dependent peptidase